MKSLIYFYILITVATFSEISAQSRIQNVVVIMYDGVSWEEIFTGADTNLIKDERFVESTIRMNSMYNNTSEEIRRRVVAPFIWSHFLEKGQIWGNRNKNSFVDFVNPSGGRVSNYAEILCGTNLSLDYTLNEELLNPYTSLFEELYNYKELKGDFAGFSSWEFFNFVLRSDGSKLYCNSGYYPVRYRDANIVEITLNKILSNMPVFWKDARFDVITQEYALEHIKSRSPKMVVISYNDAIKYKEQNQYDNHLDAIRRYESFAMRVSELLDTLDFYKNKTLLIITGTGGGKGFGSDSSKIYKVGNNSNSNWFAISGPNIEPLGAMENTQQIYMNRLAPTIAKMLGYEFPFIQDSGEERNSAAGKLIDIYAEPISIPLKE